MDNCFPYIRCSSPHPLSFPLFFMTDWLPSHFFPFSLPVSFLAVALIQYPQIVPFPPVPRSLACERSKLSRPLATFPRDSFILLLKAPSFFFSFPLSSRWCVTEHRFPFLVSFGSEIQVSSQPPFGTPLTSLVVEITVVDISRTFRALPKFWNGPPR